MRNLFFEDETVLLDLSRIRVIRDMEVFFEGLPGPVSFRPDTLNALKDAFKQYLNGSVAETDNAPSATSHNATSDLDALPSKALFLTYDPRPAFRLSFLMLVSSKKVNGSDRSAARFFYPQAPARGFERIGGDGHWRQAFDGKGLFRHAVQLRLPTQVDVEHTFRHGFEPAVWESIQLQVSELVRGVGGVRWEFPMATPENYQRGRRVN